MGLSRTNITPLEPVMMSGYAARKTPSTGVHDSLYTAALCFSDGNQKALMITCDVIGFSHEQADQLSARIAENTGIPGENILITATHTHGAPSIGTYGTLSFEANRKYMDFLEKKIVAISRSASENLQDVKIGRGRGSCQLNINRRAQFADGSIWLGRNSEGPCDHDVDILKIESMRGDLLAVFVNWACHGTASGQDNYQITGDWPGISARYLEEELGQETVIYVTAGASGDINPLYGPNDKFMEIQAVGYNLAQEVLQVLPGITSSTQEQLNVTQKSLVLPGKKRLDNRYPPKGFETGEDVEVRLSALRFGEIVFTGISGEVMTEIGMQIKEGSPSKAPFVITHCNGSSGYICTDKAFPEGGYEVMVTRLMPGAEKTITDSLLELVYNLDGH
jgi:hypothetical protein